jgi:hypothetical protein
MRFSPANAFPTPVRDLPAPDGASEMRMSEDHLNQFDWAQLVPHCIHPLKVAIVEAMLWIERPISPVELQKVFFEEFSLSLVAYHVTTLAQAGVLVQVGRQPVRGAMKRFYFFPGRSWERDSGALEPR